MVKKSVIISGSGRGGTTWVLDSLAEANNMRTVFEPLHPIGVPSASKFSHRYIPEDESNLELERFFNKVLSGEMRSIWANYRIRPDRFNPLRNSPITVYLHSKKSIQLLKKYALKSHLSGQVVKFIRANLMLPWIAKHYDCPTVLVIRHPCAVIASRLKLSSADWGADKALARYREDKMIYDLIGNRFGVDLSQSMSTAEALCTVWCIENVLPLEWSSDSGYAVVSYEKLMVNPAEEWQKLVDYLGLDKVPDSDLLGSPSQQSSQDMRHQNFTSEHIERWKKNLDAKTIDDIASTLDKFGSTIYSVDDALPTSHISMVGDK